MTTHDKLPPTLPQIVDEAGDTAAWVPALGIGLLVAILMLAAFHSAGGTPSAPGAAPQPAADAPAPTLPAPPG